MVSRRRKIKALLAIAVIKDSGTAMPSIHKDPFLDQFDGIVQGVVRHARPGETIRPAATCP
jgi:hypothetical protein